MKPKKIHWGKLTQSILDGEVNNNQFVPIEIIRTIAIFKKIFSSIDTRVPKNMKHALVSSLDEIIQNKHEKQFPLSINNKNIATNINNNINEVVSYLIERKVNKKIDLKILDFLNKPSDYFNNAISICLVEKINNHLFIAINKLTQYFWKEKRIYQNEKSPFTKKINLKIHINEIAEQNIKKIDTYNKELNEYKVEIFTLLNKILKLSFDKTSQNDEFFKQLSDKYNLYFMGDLYSSLFLNNRLLKINYEIHCLLLSIFKIIQNELDEASYTFFINLHKNVRNNEISMTKFLELKNPGKIYLIINTNILLVQKIVDLFIKKKKKD